MTDSKMHRLSIPDTTRINALLDRYQSEMQKLGMRKLNRTIILRALIFLGEKTATEDFVEAIKQAQIYA